MDTQSREFTLQVDPELGEEAPYQAPLWILIVSVVAGVLLLGLIIILMWKCGFFQRERPCQSVPTYHGVKIGKEERYQDNEGFLIQEPPSNKKIKKHWITNWTEM